MTSLKTNKKCEECDTESELNYCGRCDIWFCEDHMKTHITSKVCEYCEEELCEEWFISLVPDDEFWNSSICFHCNTRINLIKLVMSAKEISKTNEDVAKITMCKVSEMMKKIGYY